MMLRRRHRGMELEAGPVAVEMFDSHRLLRYRMVPDEAVQ